MYCHNKMMCLFVVSCARPFWTWRRCCKHYVATRASILWLHAPTETEQRSEQAASCDLRGAGLNMEWMSTADTSYVRKLSFHEHSMTILVRKLSGRV